MVFFDSVNTDSSGIYFSWLRRIPTPQPIERLIGTGDLLDGKTLASVSMTDSAVFSYSVTFRADFVDGSSGIYTAIAYVPEPSSLVGVVAIGLFVRTRRRRSKRCQPPFS